MGARVVLSHDGAIVSEVELAKALFVVGRHPDCDLVIDDPAISGRHMLFRTVGSTVYAEDLGSTNGILVNGVATGSQVVHHLDVVEIGRHKVHFFDDALLAGGVRDLESTVLTDYERTMLATQAAPAPAPPPRPAPGPAELSRTMAIVRDPSLVQAVAGQLPGREAAGLALRILAGEGQGGSVSLDKANTMIGHTGTGTALVVRRGQSFYVARLAGSRPPLLNGKELGPGTHAIAANDIIEVGGGRFEVVTATAEAADAPQG